MHVQFVYEVPGVQIIDRRGLHRLAQTLTERNDSNSRQFSDLQLPAPDVQTGHRPV